MCSTAFRRTGRGAEPAPQSPPFPLSFPFPFPFPLPWPPPCPWLFCATAVTKTVLPAGSCPVGWTDTTVPGSWWSLVVQATRGRRPSSRNCRLTVPTGWPTRWPPLTVTVRGAEALDDAGAADDWAGCDGDAPPSVDATSHPARPAITATAARARAIPWLGHDLVPGRR